MADAKNEHSLSILALNDGPHLIEPLDSVVEVDIEVG
jgi:hypothetical protein